VAENITEAVDAISDSVSYAEKMAGIGITSAVVSINGKSIFSNNTRGVIAVAGDEIGYEDVRRAVESAKTAAIPQQVRSTIHVLPRQYIVDSQAGIQEPVGMTGARLEVDAHIISSLTTTLHNIEKSLQQVGVRSIPVFAGLASAQSVLTNTEKELGVMVLDIGYGTTTITIYQEGAIAYSGCVILGGYAITSDLAVCLQIKSEDAEKLKKNIGKYIDEHARKSGETPVVSNTPSYLRADLESKKSTKHEDENYDEDLIDISGLQIPNQDKISRQMYENIVSARLEEIFQLVSDQVSMAGFSIKQPAGVVITGGTANLYNIARYASKYYGTPARVGMPQGLGGPLIDEITDPEFACVQGLILRSVDFLDTYTESYDDGAMPAGGNLFKKVKGMFKNLMP